MKNTPKKSDGTVFVNTTITKQFPNGPKVSAEFHIIVTQNKNDEWVIDCIEPLEIDEIEMMGVTITDLESKRNTIKHFQSIGIDLWEGMEKDMNEFVDMSGGAVTFVNEQTGIILPSNSSKSTKPIPSYVEIIADLKRQFGNISYYNDKRKDSRRIKILSGKNKEIQKYMKRKYPHIETYYNDGHTWSIGLCFKLPL
jgi:hypothetical protein